jgi:predicted Zn finger-like uncharacterized protein
MLIAQCPACQTRYKVPNAVAGRRAKCKKCGQPFQIPVAPPDSGRLSLTTLTPADDDSTVIQTRPRPNEKPAAGKGGKGLRLRSEAEEKETAARSVWRPFMRGLVGCIWAPFLPLNIAPFVIVWVLLTVIKPALWSFLICTPVGYALWAIVSGWYFSFQFNTVVNAADGKDELAALGPSGFMDDIFIPLLKLGLTRLLALLPAAIFVAALILTRGGSFRTARGIGPALSPLNIYLTSAGTPADAATPIITLVLLAAGLAFWPMLVLAVLGGARDMFRLGQIVRTLRRTAAAYACVVLTVFAAAAVGIVLGVALPWDDGPAAEINLTHMLVFPALLALADVYLTVIAMRATGLYYYHFKQKFA